MEDPTSGVRKYVVNQGSKSLCFKKDQEGLSEVPRVRTVSPVCLWDRLGRRSLVASFLVSGDSVGSRSVRGRADPEVT